LLASFGKLHQFFFVLSYSLLTSTQTLILVITAVIIAAEVILLVYFLKSRRKKKEAFAINENQETASFRSTIEKIEDLEAEKENLISQIDELKKTADAKAATLESEVNALRDEMNKRKSLMGVPEAGVDSELKKNHKHNASEN